MLERLRSARKVVGSRRLLRAVEAGEVAEVFVARDCDLYLYRQVTETCRAKGVPVTECDSMKQLGEACGVEVKTASAGILR